MKGPRMKKLVIGGAAAVATAGIGLGIAQFANADESPSPVPSASTSAANGQSDLQSPSPGSDDNKARGGKGRHMDLSELAAKLGVEDSKLQEAMEAIRSEHRANEEASPADRRAAMARALAEKLGVEESKVTSALEELRSAQQAERAARDQKVLDDAVSAGTLTQDEANAVKKAAEAGIVEIEGGGRP